jgi:hypothetical protein
LAYRPVLHRLSCPTLRALLSCCQPLVSQTLSVNCGDERVHRTGQCTAVSCPSRPHLRRQPHHFRHGRAHNRQVRWHRCRRSQDYAPRLIVCTVHKLVK